MEYIVYRIFLDMHTVSSQVSLRVKKGDTSRKISATLREGGKPYQIADDCYAAFSARKPDGNYIYNICLIEGNTITYTFTSQTVPVEGTMDCEIILYNAEGQVITSPRFTMIVEDRVYNDEEIVSSAEATALVELLKQTDTVIDAAILRINSAINRADEAANEARNKTNEAIIRVDESMAAINSSFANAFKGKLSGAVVQADDVSPIEHIVGCKVRSKNLFNDMLDYVKTAESEWKYESGTLYVANYYVNKLITLEEEKTYTISYSSTKTGGDGGGIYIRAYKEKNTNEYKILNYNTYSTDSSVTFTMPKGYPVLRITFYGDTAPSTYSATYSNIMLEEGSTATEYVPYIEDLSAVVVNRCGKNLVSPNLHTGKMGGYTYTPNEDGSVTISGAATTTSQHVIALALKNSSGENETVRLVPNQTYTLTIYKDGEKTTGVGTKVEFDDGTIKWGFDKVSTKPRKLTLVYVQFTPVVGDTEHCGTYHVQLELGDKATEYEKYIGEEYSVAADGTVNDMTSLSHYMTIFSDTANILIDCEYNKDSNKVYEELYSFLEQGGLTGPAARIANVKILADKWVGTESPYSQVVSIEGITPNSQVDLTPSAEQLAIFYNKDLAFVTENENGVVTVYAIGQKPANDYTIQATITEVIR